MIRRYLARAGAVFGLMAGASLIPTSAAHADVIGIGDVNVHDVLNCLSVIIG